MKQMLLVLTLLMMNTLCRVESSPLKWVHLFLNNNGNAVRARNSSVVPEATSDKTAKE